MKNLDIKMNNRVIGLTIIKALNSNFNADFTGAPRQVLDTFVASPFAIKYCIKKYWESIGEKVFYSKSFKQTEKVKNKGKNNEEEVIEITPNNIKERTELLFNKKKYSGAGELLLDLFTCIDVRCFGHLMPTTGMNSNSTGAIQYGMGINRFKGSEIVEHEVLSPFQNENKKDSEQSTMGTRQVLDQGHFVYDFLITPWVYDQLSYIDNFKGFTRKDYELFKEASLVSVSNYNSIAKKDCFNELGLYVELKEGSKKVINAPLAELVDVYNKDGEDATTIDLSRLKEVLLKIKDEIESIELYYNPITTKVLGLSKDDFESLIVEDIMISQKFDFGAY